MFFKTLRDLARPQVVAIFDVLKRSEGLAVGDLADALKMSYMGVKQYCIELEKRGYLDTWRRAKETGRPELTYRLTPKAQLLFPQHSNELSLEILDAVRQLHGPTAAEKILYQYFLKKTEAYAKRIKGKSLIERATSLAKLRENEGHCAQIDYDARHGLRLTEYHSPLSELIKEYPSVARMEESMISRLLQAPVQRDLSAVSGLMRISFLVAGASLPPPPPPTTTLRPRTPVKRPAKDTTAINEPALAHRAETGLAPHADATSEAVSAVLPTPIPDEVMPVEAPAFEAAESPPEAVSTDEAMEIASDLEVAASAPDNDPVPLPAAPHIVSQEAEPLLFATPATPSSPRMAVRPLAPARAAAKASEPEVQELFLSL